MAGITIHDVAKEARVSIATVSYVLNNSRRVGDETRTRVLQAITLLGYRPNITARNLQASKTRLLGYSWRPVPPSQFTPVLDQFWQSMAQAAAHHDYRILAFPTATPQEELAVYEEMMLSGQVDGFVLSNTNLEDPRVRALLGAGFPFVAFGRSNPEWDFPWVDVDGYAGIRMAMEHLIAGGHQRIACLAWPAPSLTGRYRLDGYYEAMAAANLPVSPAWVARIENTYDDAYPSTQHLLALSPAQRPSAIVAFTDLMAMGAINAATDAGMTVGRELAVVGFDDAPVARFLRPPLTSLRQPVAEVGEGLVTMLIDLVNGRSVAEPHVLLQPELIVRASSVPSSAAMTSLNRTQWSAPMGVDGRSCN